MGDVFRQGSFRLRLDWGPAGARAMAADVAVVVDVLSFSTAVSVAVERRMTVLPYWWKGPDAVEYARSHDAVLAVGRLEATKLDGPPPPSLSPAGLLTCDHVPRLVLPSPNGSTICMTLRESGSEVAIGCLRNAAAVASWLAPVLRDGGSVAVVAAGERWAADDSLRPALEDQLGAGAVVSHLRRLGLAAGASPEALAAAALFDAVRDDLPGVLRDCVGGRELAAVGYGEDVDVAAALDVSGTVPVLVAGELVSAAEPAVG